MTQARGEYGKALAQGSLWVAVGQTVGAVTGLVSSLVAAKLLVPSDFGIMGVALLSIATLNALSQTGFDQALIQRKNVEDGYLDAAWTVQVARGALLSAIVLTLSWPLATFYGEPSLLGIFVVMACSLLVAGTRNVSTVLFNRTLGFRIIVLTGVIKAVAKLLFVLLLLFYLRSVWALVFGHLFASVTDVVLSYWIRPYRPRLSWDLEKAKQLARFGKWVSLMGILGLLVTRGDDMFISKYLGLAALGYYGLAYEIANLPATHVTHVLGKVSFPAYARLNDEATRATMRRTFLNVAKATLLITGPLSVLIFCTIDSIVLYLLGAKWLPIVPLVRVLVAAGFLRSIAALATGVFHGAGRPHLDFWMNLPRLGLLAFLIWPACAWGGLQGASWLILVAVLSCFPTWALGLGAILKLTASEFLRETAIAVVLSGSLLLCFRASERLVEVSSLGTFCTQLTLALLLWSVSAYGLQKTTRFRLWDEVQALSQALRTKPA